MHALHLCFAIGQLCSTSFSVRQNRRLHPLLLTTLSRTSGPVLGVCFANSFTDLCLLHELRFAALPFFA